VGGRVRIVCLSDTHTQHSAVEVPDGDILIHAGDFTYTGKEGESQAFASWLRKLPHKHKVVIAGNHELGWGSKPMWEKRGLLHPAHYLEGRTVELMGLKIWGGPWTPWFYDWEFNVPRDQIGRFWEKIPDDTDVLATHGPPRGIMDESKRDERVGDDALLEAVYRVKPRLHCYGHIHEGYGRVDMDRAGGWPITFVNAATCDARYKPVNPPIVVDLDVP